MATPRLPAAPSVVLITLFEPSPEVPGEFREFRIANRLEPVAELAGGFAPLHANAAGLVATVAGIGPAQAAATVMALGLDPRMDLRRTTFVVAGIAGMNPAAGTLGSVAWARHVVNGDLAHEIHPAEHPADWPHGVFALGTSHPSARPARPPGDLFLDDEAFTLDAGLVDTALALSRRVDLSVVDSPALAAVRALYADSPAASTAGPRVMEGDTLSTTRYWHGRRLNAWAEDWVRLWTSGHGRFATSAMEDAAILRVLRRLEASGRVDARRVLVARAGSNFTHQPPGWTALESLRGGPEGADRAGAAAESMFPGYDAARRALQLAVQPVLDALIAESSRVPC